MLLLLLLMTLGSGSTPFTVEVAPGEMLTVCAEGPEGGDPVIIVPGLSGCTYGFRKLTPLLHGQGLSTIIIEALAVGESSRPEGADYTMTAQAGRIGAVLDSLGIDHAVFVGQGIGGAIVFRLAAERPELVSGLVSIEGVATEDALTQHNRSSIQVAKAVCKLGGSGLLKDRFEESLREASGDDSWIDRLTLGRYFRGINRDVGAALDAFSAMMSQTEPWAMTPRLPTIEVPVLLLMGTAPHEGAVSVEDLDALSQGLPSFQVVEVDGAGHFIHEEQPQIVADAVVRFVAEVNGIAEASSGSGAMPTDNGRSDLVQSGNSR